MGRLRDRGLFVQDQSSRLEESERSEVLAHRAPVPPPENASQVHRMNACMARAGAERDGRAKFVAEEFFGATEPPGPWSELGPGVELDERLEQLQGLILALGGGGLALLEHG